MNKVIENRSNVTRFKEILLELHRGKEPSSLFDQFHDVISSADATECEEIKQQMVIEGVPRKRAKKWTRHQLFHRELSHRSN
ncbi:MAG: DUF438 domain-containing protein [Deltaproteobacteria bacterium]|nr:DUF438 domain-containing protein [Deltaproteobacteria bacterium]